MNEIMRDRMLELRRQERKWASNVQDGSVLPVSSDEGEEMVLGGEYKLLDVRPPKEYEAGRVNPSEHIPTFLPQLPAEDIRGKLSDFFIYITLTAFSGETKMRVNEDFPKEVKSTFPDKDQPILVVCQTGQRSILAADLLRSYGYNKVAWLDGGYQKAKGNAFNRGFLDIQLSEGCEKLSYAGISGISKDLNWTDLQRQEKNGNIIRLGKALVLFLLFDAFAFGIISLV